MTAIDWKAKTARTRSFVAIFEAVRGAPASIDTKLEAAHMASHYRYFRNVRHMPATAARSVDRVPFHRSAGETVTLAFADWQRYGEVIPTLERDADGRAVRC